MKTPEEWLKQDEFQLSDTPTDAQLINIIKAIQYDAWCDGVQTAQQTVQYYYKPFSECRMMVGNIDALLIGLLTRAGLANRVGTVEDDVKPYC